MDIPTALGHKKSMSRNPAWNPSLGRCIGNGGVCWLAWVLSLIWLPLGHTEDSPNHWAFAPLRAQLPEGISAAASPIDSLIHQRLEEVGLPHAPEADPTTLLRRLYLDVTGLPPKPDDLNRFLEKPDASAWMREVDRVLASPRYGERMAQPWLDLVRYADTHGFEVNTPRPNAWPYRDYVIQAFNEDLPYDQFIQEQLCGDQFGKDAATGFLVAAPVLLPGQIGKDDASKRLARQDSLDEMVIGTGETFLGLTLGCARCHDHKFDDFSQEEYYRFQSYFAGVEYGDRVLRTPDSQARQKKARELAPQLDQLEERLLQFEPLAFTGRSLLIDELDPEHTFPFSQPRGPGVIPEGQEPGRREDPGSKDRLPHLGFGKYTWWSHLPDEDVLAYRPRLSGSFRVWISWGVHGSGVHTRDARYILDRDGNRETREDQTEIARVDQYYPAGIRSGLTPKEPRWSGFLDAGIWEMTESSILLVRGGDTGTGVTADTLLLQEDSGLTSPLPHLREPVQPSVNVERFTPNTYRTIRFTTLETIDQNRHQPCLDELEIYGPDQPSINLAQANRGATPSSSGNLSNTGKHQLPHINDGQWGNDKSWISNEKGAGWVAITLPKPTEVNQVVWGRDRTGKYKDRLPVRYRIEGSLDGTNWTLLASHEDRAPQGTPTDPSLFRLRNLAGQERLEAAQLARERDTLKARIQELKQEENVYAGKFREPDLIRVLRRGDPEQPLDEVGPLPPSLLGNVAPISFSSEAERRLSLARWITGPAAPLTARVLANRIWQQHFGTGLVETPSDFGRNGARPSHPALLDWLASELIRSNWSVKALHRAILNSETYRRASVPPPGVRAQDADNRLLAYFPSRRLEAEVIRDGMLAAAGRLQLDMGGPGYDFFQSRGGLSGFPPKETFGPREWRRMIYAHKIRMERVPVFGEFDCPDAGQPQPVRSRSTTALQALNLFNSTFVLEQAAALCQRATAEAGSSEASQLEFLFLWTLGRPPTPKESMAGLASMQQHGPLPIARALFNSNEFLFLP